MAFGANSRTGAIEGPKVPYEKKADANPVMQGRLLSIGAWLSVAHHGS